MNYHRPEYNIGHEGSEWLHAYNSALRTIVKTGWVATVRFWICYACYLDYLDGNLQLCYCVLEVIIVGTSAANCVGSYGVVVDLLVAYYLG